MRTMALALGTFLGDTQPATHHGESKGFLKVVWYCGMYMQIFQCVSGSPYLHWQAMPAVARGSVARASLSNLYLCPTYMREWYVTGVGHTSLSSASIRSGEIIIPSKCGTKGGPSPILDSARVHCAHLAREESVHWEHPEVGI